MPAGLVIGMGMRLEAGGGNFLFGRIQIVDNVSLAIVVAKHNL